MKRKIALVPIVIAGIVILFQFIGSEKYTNPETGKKARVALSPREETALGLQSYREVLANSETVQNGPEVDQVVRVTKRLTGATGSAASDFEWQVSVIRSQQA